MTPFDVNTSIHAIACGELMSGLDGYVFFRGLVSRLGEPPR